MKKTILKITLLLSLFIGFTACSQDRNGSTTEDKSEITCHNNLEINIIGHNKYLNGIFYNIDQTTSKITQCKKNVKYSKSNLGTECFKGLEILSFRFSKYNNGYIYNRTSNSEVVKCNSNYIENKEI